MAEIHVLREIENFIVCRDNTADDTVKNDTSRLVGILEADSGGTQNNVREVLWLRKILRSAFECSEGTAATELEYNRLLQYLNDLLKEKRKKLRKSRCYIYFLDWKDGIEGPPCDIVRNVVTVAKDEIEARESVVGGSERDASETVGGWRAARADFWTSDTYTSCKKIGVALSTAADFSFEYYIDR